MGEAKGLSCGELPFGDATGEASPNGFAMFTPLRHRDTTAVRCDRFPPACKFREIKRGHEAEKAK